MAFPVGEIISPSIFSIPASFPKIPNDQKEEQKGQKKEEEKKEEQKKEEQKKQKEEKKEEKGQKFSDDKIPLFTVIFKQFPNAIREVAKCSQAGHKKYPADTDWMNFKRVENAKESYRNAAIRHLMESGVNQDMKEYGEILHEAQAIWNLLAALELSLEDKKS
jgi:hypothetical protein